MRFLHHRTIIAPPPSVPTPLSYTIDPFFPVMRTEPQLPSTDSLELWMVDHKSGGAEVLSLTVIADVPVHFAQLSRNGGGVRSV